MDGDLDLRRRAGVPALGHLVPVAQALLVTVLWSSSYVLIEVGLAEIPSLTFAGLRYSLAFLCLLPLALRPRHRATARGLSRRDWGWLLALGLTLYALTQGAQFVALEYLPAATVSLVLNFTAVLVAVGGVGALGERPRLGQWGGVVLAVGGALLYFYPPVFPAARVVGLAVMAVGLVSNAGAALVGRHVNRAAHTSPVVVTTASMGVGGGLLLATGVAVQGLPALSATSWAIVAWLAVVNTAFAFTLWNHTLQRLAAVESAVINNTMLVQVAILGWVFLGQSLTPTEVAGLLVVTVGTAVVQLRRG